MNRYYFNLRGKAFNPVPSDKADFRVAKEHEVKTAKQHGKEITRIENKIHRLKKELVILKEDCHHLVFYDEDGYMYDTRYCVACGINTLL